MWIDKNIGHLPFNKITKTDVENVFYGIVESGKSIRTAEYALTTLKQLWRKAKDSGHAPVMPVVSKSLKKRISQNNNSRIRFLSHAEAEILLNELEFRSIDLYEKALISLHCGLRASEIFKLKWIRVDIEHGIFGLGPNIGRSSYLAGQRGQAFIIDVIGQRNIIKS